MEWNLLLNAFLALIAILNPVGNVPVFLENVENEPIKVQKLMGVLLAGVIFIILFIFFLTGTSILSFFGITIPAFRLAGAILILLVGIRLMNGRSKFANEGLEAAQPNTDIFTQAKKQLSRIIVPVAIPIFVGPGTITTVILYANSPTNALTHWSLVLVLILCTSIVALCLYFSGYIQKVLGANGMQIVTRVFGMILVAIAMQFLIEGVAMLFPGALNPEFVHGMKDVVSK